jgi:uncharacterized protein
MSLNTQLDDDFKQAFKGKDAEKLSILRLVRSSIKNLEIKTQGEASEEDVVEILQREIKQHKESIEAFEKADRPDEVKRLKQESDLLQAYLPDQLSSDEIKDVVEKAIQETDASNMADMGKVMGSVMGKVKGRAGGDEVGNMVRDLLQGKE